MSKIVAFDPSGNWKEGKGTTGVCVMVNGDPTDLYEIGAKRTPSAEEYWAHHIGFIKQFEPWEMVVEGYKLYNHKGKSASMQANSELETPQLIGAIKLYCYMNDIPLAIQFASEVKTRWSDDVLVAKGYLERKGKNLYFNGKLTNTHKRDALRHALHYYRYGRKDK